MRTLTACLAFLTVVPAASADDPMRCGNWLIEIPISLEDLLSKCGEPTAKEVSTQDIRAGSKSGTGSRAVGTTTTEKWTYRASAQAVPMVVTIVDGKVTRIAPGK